jgi:Ca2+-binding EF-hand superfamily protein
METLGTIYTMSPEVLRGDYDKQADMWSIGVVTFQLLANEKPFWGDTTQEVANRVLVGKFTFDAPVWKKISWQAKDFIKKLLVMDPRARLTAQRALNHPWISDLTRKSDISSSSAQQLMKSLSGFEKSSELKKLALQVIAHKTTTDEIMQMREVFHAIDVDHDGRITLKEFKNAHRGTCSAKEIEQLFKSIDVDESGSIDYTEFLAATLEAQGEIREQHIKDAFDVFDLDQNGFISPEEIRTVSGNEADLDYIDRLVKEADTNKDGKISFAEFQAAVRKTTKDMVDEFKVTRKFPLMSSNEEKFKRQSPTTDKSDNFDPDEVAA